MEILLWLAPPAVVTVVAMLWVAWLGRESRGLVDRDEAIARLGKALEAEPTRRHRRPGYAVTEAVHDRSSGIAIRHPSPAEQPAEQPVAQPRPTSEPGHNGDDRPPAQRFAS